jgi:hypothetical protein
MRRVPHLPARRSRIARAAVAAILAGALVLTIAAVALAADPTPSPASGDPRSNGQGPGFVGQPLLAIGIVAAVGLGAVAATLVYVRLTARR